MSLCFRDALYASFIQMAPAPVVMRDTSCHFPETVVPESGEVTSRLSQSCDGKGGSDGSGSLGPFHVICPGGKADPNGRSSPGQDRSHLDSARC